LGNHWLYPEGDGLQLPLRFSFQPRLTPSVRLLKLHRMHGLKNVA
jgi:hypothetical protein